MESVEYALLFGTAKITTPLRLEYTSNKHPPYRPGAFLTLLLTASRACFVHHNNFRNLSLLKREKAASY